MSAAITVASRALQASNAVTGQQSQTVRHGGRHWSYGVMIFAAIAGAVTVVVAGIFVQIPLIVAGAALCLVGIIGSINIKKLGILRSLEDYVDQLAERVTQLSNTVKQAREANHELERVNHEIGETLHQRERLVAQQQKKLQQMSAVCQTLQGVAADLTKGIADVGPYGETLGKDVDEMLLSIRQYDEINKGIDGESNELADQMRRFDEEDEEFKQENRRLEGTVEKSQEFLAAMKKQNVEVQKLNKTIRNQEKKLAAAAKREEELNLSLQKALLVIEELKKRTDQLQHIPEILQALEGQKAASSKPKSSHKTKPKKRAP